jgi:hypothetical protein
MAGSCFISVINNSVSNESRFYCFDILKKCPKYMIQHSNFPLRAARDRTARGNGTTAHYTSQLAARHKTAVASHCDSGDNAGRRGW